MQTEQLIEEAVQKIVKAVNQRFEVFEMSGIDRYTESCIRSELITIASKSGEEGRNQVHEEYLDIHRQELTPILERKFEEWKQFVSKLALSNPTTLDTVREGGVMQDTMLLETAYFQHEAWFEICDLKKHGKASENNVSGFIIGKRIVNSYGRVREVWEDGTYYDVHDGEKG